MTTTLTQIIAGICLSMLLFSGTSFATEPTDVGNFVKARIEIGEMMTNYFKGARGTAMGSGHHLKPCEKWAWISIGKSATS